jgi:hypothetical protein
MLNRAPEHNRMPFGLIQPDSRKCSQKTSQPWPPGSGFRWRTSGVHILFGGPVWLAICMAFRGGPLGRRKHRVTRQPAFWPPHAPMVPRGDTQFGGAVGLTSADREKLPQLPLRLAIQLHRPAGVLGEVPELLAAVPRGPCSPAHAGHLGDRHRLLAHGGMVERKNCLVKP